MRSIIFAIPLFLLIFTIDAAACDKAKASAKNENAIETLLQGLNSDNYGLKTSSAFMLGELRTEKAVIPLMKMLHNDKSEDARIVAALSLYKIGTPLAMNAVKQAVRFDESERVKKMCRNYYVDFYKATDKVNNPIAIK